MFSFFFCTCIDHDKYSTNFVKLSAIKISPSLAKLYNKCVKYGV